MWLGVCDSIGSGGGRGGSRSDDSGSSSESDSRLSLALPPRLPSSGREGDEVTGETTARGDGGEYRLWCLFGVSVDNELLLRKWLVAGAPGDGVRRRLPMLVEKRS